MHWVGLSAAFCLLAVYASYNGMEYLGLGVALLAAYLAFNASEALGRCSPFKRRR